MVTHARNHRDYVEMARSPSSASQKIQHGIAVALILFVLEGVFNVSLANVPIHLSQTVHANDWPQVAGNPQRTGQSPETLGTSVSNVWVRSFQPETIYPQVQPIVAGGKVYVPVQQGKVYAFDAIAGGSPLWAHTLATKAPIMASVAVSGTSAYFGAMDGAVYSLSTVDGSLQWRTKVGRHGFTTAPLLMDNLVMMGGRDGFFYAFHPATGAIQWQYDAGSPVLMTAAGNNGKAYFGSMDMRFHAVNTADGSQAWRTNPLGGMAFKDYWPVVHGGYVIVRPMGIPSALYALSETNGTQLAGLPQNDKNVMHGAANPPCVDRDGYLIVPVDATWDQSWKGGWGRLDLATKTVVANLADPANPTRGTGNRDESFGVTCSQNLVFTFHTQEGNAHFTGFFDLDAGVWTTVSRYSASNELSTNTQGGGANPVAISNGYIYHITLHNLNVRRLP